jgi:hypothetical protein
MSEMYHIKEILKQISIDSDIWMLDEFFEELLSKLNSQTNQDSSI